MDLKNIYHLYSRAGFGIGLKEAAKLKASSTKDIVQNLLKGEGEKKNLNLVNKEELPSRMEVKGMGPEEKKELQKLARDKIKDLNVAWIRQLVTTTSPLLEKTTLFWHGHFACRVENPYTMQELNNIQRREAFSPFKDLLMAVSKSPAMLQFLNNRQNHKQHPNENFARELMELFTIGRGNYTEQDIKESARAFTGWTFVPDSYEFRFNEKDHDDEVKTFMQETGNFTGEDIIDKLLQKKQTAAFLCRKFYHFFVNETVNDKRVDELADFYMKNNYDTGKLLQKIFTSDWFYTAENMGCNIKSPIELIVGFSKAFDIVPATEALLKMQRALGQVLFYPPNVAGWPGGRNWIDSTSLMLRLKGPSVILNGGKIEVVEKEDMPEDNFNLPDTIKLNPDNKPFYVGAKPEELMDNLLRPALNDTKKNLLLNDIMSNKQLVLKIVSMPEYQLC